MTKQITLEEALKLVSFYHSDNYGWQVRNVNNNVYGNVDGNIFGNIFGNVDGTINGRKWESVESPKDKLQRLITESGNQELIDAFNELDN